jgi:hypothetical protein
VDAWCTPKKIRANHLTDQLASLEGDPGGARLASDHVIDIFKSKAYRDDPSDHHTAEVLTVDRDHTLAVEGDLQSRLQCGHKETDSVTTVLGVCRNIQVDFGNGSVKVSFAAPLKRR